MILTNIKYIFNHEKNYKASEFDKATGWSKFLDVNEQSVMIKGALNPTNNSEINTDWLDDF